MAPFAVQGIHQRGSDRLGHAVQLQQRRPDATVPGGLLGEAEVLGEGDHPKAVRAPVGPALLGEDHPDRRCEQAGDRRPVADRGVNPAAGAEPRGEHDGRARDERAHHRVVLRVGVEQRQHDEEAVVGHQPETGRHRLAGEHVVGVGDADALRPGGRPRRVHHGKVAEWTAVRDRGLGGLTVGGRWQVALALPHLAAEPGDVTRRTHRVTAIAIGHRQHRAHVSEDVLQLGDGAGDIGRHHHGTAQGTAEPVKDELGPVGEMEVDVVTGRHSCHGQRPGDRRGSLEHLPPRELLHAAVEVVEHQQDPVGRPLGASAQDVGDRPVADNGQDVRVSHRARCSHAPCAPGMSWRAKLGSPIFTRTTVSGRQRSRQR